MSSRAGAAGPTLSMLMALSFAPVFALIGCAQPTLTEPASPPKPPTLDLAAFDLVDLTYPYDENTVFWPTSPTQFSLERLAYGIGDQGFFYAANRFCTPEHGGTHLDAPIHFAEGRHTVDQVPLERLIGPAIVIDISEHAATDPDYRLSVEDLERFEAQHGSVPAGAIVLVHTGWGQYWGNARAYLGDASPSDDGPGDASDLHFPSFGEAAIRRLVEARKIAAIGIDTASIDHGPSSDFPVHRLVAAENIPGLENVAGLEQLPPTGAWVIALPMKIAGGSGGPVRIVALLPKSPST